MGRLAWGEQTPIELLSGATLLILTWSVGFVFVRRRESREAAEAVRRTQDLEAEAREGAVRTRLASAIEGAAVGHWFWDLETDQFYVSDGWARELGYGRAELSGHPDDWFGRVHPYY